MPNGKQPNDTLARGPRILCPMALAGIALSMALGCEDNPNVATTVYPYTYYPYAYYYPTDLYYSDMYYTDDWYSYPTFYSGTAALTESGQTAGAYLRELAVGADICPDHVIVEPREELVACGGDAQGMMRTGARITLAGCELDNGGQLDGMVDIASTRSFSSNACDAATVVSIEFTSTFANFVYTAPDGERFVLPTLTSVGASTRLLSGRPVALSVTSSGRLERYDAAGNLLTQVAVSGTQGVVLDVNDDSTPLGIDGTLTLQDLQTAETVTVTGSAVTLQQGCCHPTSGLMLVSSSSGESHDIVFSSDCGQATLDGDMVSLPACP